MWKPWNCFLVVRHIFPNNCNDDKLSSWKPNKNHTQSPRDRFTRSRTKSLVLIRFAVLIWGMVLRSCCVFCGQLANSLAAELKYKHDRVHISCVCVWIWWWRICYVFECNDRTMEALYTSELKTHIEFDMVYVCEQERSMWCATGINRSEPQCVHSARGGPEFGELSVDTYISFIQSTHHHENAIPRRRYWVKWNWMWFYYRSSSANKLYKYIIRVLSSDKWWYLLYRRCFWKDMYLLFNPTRFSTTQF